VVGRSCAELQHSRLGLADLRGGFQFQNAFLRALGSATKKANQEGYPPILDHHPGCHLPAGLEKFHCQTSLTISLPLSFLALRALQFGHLIPCLVGALGTIALKGQQKSVQLHRTFDHRRPASFDEWGLPS
jgi:hypothetical protein